VTIGGFIIYVIGRIFYAMQRKTTKRRDTSESSV
jgi:hypothetical protein